MSLRLRILLLIAAVNVGVLLLVIWFGLKAAEQVAPVGPQSLLEAWRVALTPDLEAYQPWKVIRFVVRIPAGSSRSEGAVPPGAEEEARAAGEELRRLLERGEPVVACDRRGLTYVSLSPRAEFPAWYVAFNERAHYEALGSLRRTYILFCGGTLVLILASYLVLRQLVLRPLGRLVEASQEVAEGRLPAPVPRPRGNHEVSHFVDNFNLMAREVGEYQQHLEERVLEALNRAKAAEGRLVVAQRLAATGTLAAGFAHEINNPLGGVINALRRLREGELPPDREQEYYELALDGLDRIRVIVERMLHFTPQQRKPAEFEVGEACRRAADLARHRAERNSMRLELDLQEGLPRVAGDPRELTQAVLNLILNAVDAVVAARAEAKGGGPDSGTIVVRAWREGAEAVVEVADDGIGMAPETARRCVDLFFSTKPEGEGTGLGLAIVQHIVTDHGGILDVESRPGEGTVVRMKLPGVGEA